jgi:hypothetical protein
LHSSIPFSVFSERHGVVKAPSSPFQKEIENDSGKPSKAGTTVQKTSKWNEVNKEENEFIICKEGLEVGDVPKGP